MDRRKEMNAAKRIDALTTVARVLMLDLLESGDTDFGYAFGTFLGPDWRDCDYIILL
jgi:hypothetical protein